MLFEALQFMKIIPNVIVQDLSAEIDESHRMAETYD
jgi:hypothetical protein